MPRNVAYAGAPFDDVRADVIFRSSDNVDFRTFKLFLSLASPFFEALFNFPHQPTHGDQDQEFRDGLAVVPVTEDSKTLDAFLRFCYPSTLVADPRLENLDIILNLLEAARKYCLENIERKVAEAFADPKVVKAEPLRCFVLARKRRMWEETLLAAKHTLSLPIFPSWIEGIDSIAASDLLALISYRQECSNTVCALQADLTWFRNYFRTPDEHAWLACPRRRTQGCSCPVSEKPKYRAFEEFSSPQWWEDFMEEIFSALRGRPYGAPVAQIAVKAVKAAKACCCRGCFYKIEEGMGRFADFLVKEVEKQVSQVTLRFKAP